MSYYDSTLNNNEDKQMEQSTKKLFVLWSLLGVGLAVVVVSLLFGLVALAKGFGRSQRLADERNQTQVNDIQIAQTQQLVKVQQQKAQIQIEEAKGIAESQSIIKSSLTPLYIQYLAIQAQKEQVQGQNHTIIYVPSGQNGIPLVNTVPQQ